MGPAPRGDCSSEAGLSGVGQLEMTEGWLGQPRTEAIICWIVTGDHWTRDALGQATCLPDPGRGNQVDEGWEWHGPALHLAARKHAEWRLSVATKGGRGPSPAQRCGELEPRGPAGRDGGG